MARVSKEGEGPSDPEMSGAPPPRFQHYFTARPRAPHATRSLRFLYKGRVLTFTTDRGLFSYEQVDPGTSLLIENMDLEGVERMLDLGCGWGAVGVAAAVGVPQGHVVMVDVNHRAVLLARENLRENHLENAEVRQGDLYHPVGDELFDLIVSNPPFKAGRDLVLRLMSEAPRHLRPGGRLLLVGKGSQGVLYYQRWLEERWTKVEVLGRGGGYRVLQASGFPPP
ncbi:MAG: class I SAM-dependent methyltransferase [Euryarchaeota archaeon]|nr:class I SAM-dependent methyltransferase [Euryarchaeota archaeon]